MAKITKGSVRRATPEDAEAVVRVHYETWLNTFLPLQEDLTEEIVKKRFHYRESTGLQEHTEIARGKIKNPDKNTQMFVYVSGESGLVDGFLVSGERDNRKEIRALYVRPDVQGKGIGGELMKVALEHAQAGTNPVMLEVATKNEGAIRFYKRQGFVKSRDIPEAEAREYLGKWDVYIPHIEMVREPAPL